MNFFSLRIAFRYIISKKSTNAINVITYISMLGMLVGSAALIILLSAFNGLFELNQTLFNAFNPDLKVTPIHGKVFSISDEQLSQISQVEGIEAFSRTLEENGLLRYTTAGKKRREDIATIKGVDENFLKILSIDSNMRRGDFILKDDRADYAVIGAGLEGKLSVNVHDQLRPITAYIPKRGKQGFGLNLSQIFHRNNFYPAGVFSIQTEYDYKYMLVDYDILRDQLKYKDEVSALEIKLKEGADVVMVKQALASLLGSNLNIKDSMEQNATLYKVLQLEKWAMYAILLLILIIASFNIIASLSMVVLEKRKDISILKTMGASTAYIRGIFMLQGSLVTIIGCFAGILIGVLLCIIQMYWGIIPFPGGSFVVEYYPMKFGFWDFPLVITSVIAIGLLSSWIAARRGAKEDAIILQE